MGARVEATLERHGFYPRGGGRFGASIEPAVKLEQLELMDRGELVRGFARAIVAGLPKHIAERELRVVRDRLGWSSEQTQVQELSRDRGPGNALLVRLECEHATEVISAFGERGVSAEQVGEAAAEGALKYLDEDVPVGEHLADQLLLPFALAGGGMFKTALLSSHSRTNIEVIQRFLDCSVVVEDAGRGACVVRVGD
jgi:RNA 3'-terminal phosphate cyclase (ATP)